MSSVRIRYSALRTCAPKSKMFKLNESVSFIAPNAHELIDFVMSLDNNLIDNHKFSWGDQCRVDRIPLSLESYPSSKYNVRELLKPSIDYLLNLKENLVNSSKIHITDSWVNLYDINCFQEWHDHREIDFVCVFFANSGENFSKLFFFDWNTGISTPVMPDPGTIMFFSSKRTHGVTLHNNEVQRRTLSCNFEITNHHCH